MRPAGHHRVDVGTTRVVGDTGTSDSPSVTVELHGPCDERFAAVERAFVAGFESRGELGAAVAVWSDGRLVVDLWGGLADPVVGTPWQEDTIAHAYSVSKPLVASCALLLDGTRRARAGRAGGALLARVRAGRQGGDPRPPRARPAGRPGAPP